MIRRAKLTLIATLLGAAAVGRADEPVKSDGSDVGITIMGTIIQKKSEDNVALVKEQTGAVKAIKAGHVIMDKYKVVAVTGKYVELVTREAKRYFVYQDKFADVLAQKGPQSTGPTLNGSSDQYREEGFERTKGKITMSSMYRDKLVKEDLAKVLMQATAEPHVENGTIIGFRMSQIDEGSIYNKAGVVDGDVITSINGQELTSVAGAIALLRSLKGADHVEIDLKRGNQPLKVSVDVR